MKTLEIKREGLVNEMQTILTSAKERALTADEKQKFESLRDEANGIAERINAERYVLESQKKENRTFDKEEKKLNVAYDLQRSIRNYVNGKAQHSADAEAISTEEAKLKELGMKRQSEQSLLIPDLIVAQRSVNTTSSLSNLVQSHMAPEISMSEYPIVYKLLGATEWQADPGNFLLPSINRIEAG